MQISNGGGFECFSKISIEFRNSWVYNEIEFNSQERKEKWILVFLAQFI